MKLADYPLLETTLETTADVAGRTLDAVPIDDIRVDIFEPVVESVELVGRTGSRFVGRTYRTARRNPRITLGALFLIAGAVAGVVMLWRSKSADDTEISLAHAA
ncbi:MAG: hypothetical protein WBP59_09770 [Ilumatobacteraceae bacterium]